MAIEDYSTRYRAGLDLVVKGITANIGAGEKVYTHNTIMIHDTLKINAEFVHQSAR